LFLLPPAEDCSMKTQSPLRRRGVPLSFWRGVRGEAFPLSSLPPPAPPPQRRGVGGKCSPPRGRRNFNSPPFAKEGLPEGRGGISNLFLLPPAEDCSMKTQSPLRRRGVPLSFWRGVRGEAFPLSSLPPPAPPPQRRGVSGEVFASPEEGSCYSKNPHPKTEQLWES